MKNLSRQYLQIGSELQLKNEIFRIVEVIGAGASCIVYRVEKNDEGYVSKYYLKECYPFDAQIVRSEDGTIEWLNECEKEQFLNRFEKAYRMLFDLYSDEKFTNSTAMPSGICMANGTSYYLTDIKTGTVFEEDNPENLSDVLATVISISKLIEKYHKAGYLHLDIKPSNIFVIDETRELVVLFDVDSVVPMDKLKKGEIKHISFSENYAAPEQKAEKISEIDERTDIYSIGATLFEKIMGRYVTSFDRGIFADWNFDGDPMFDSINPTTKNHIKEIFRKTLAVKNKNRYENASELIDALKNAKAACDSEVYLTSDYPAVIQNFAGRIDELNKIKLAFEQKNNIIFLQGFPGIGKSELSKKYAHDCHNDYDVIIFCKYNQSLKNTLNLIPIGNEPVDNSKYNFHDKENTLKKLLNEKVLLIIDNFDVDVVEDEYLCELSNYKANIIITTRTDFSSCELVGFTQINISTIDKTALKELFIEESGCGKISLKEEFLIDEILAAYQYHTLFVRPLAYKIKNLGYTIQSLKDEVDSELLEDIDLIVGIQNNKPFEETLKSLAEKLFKIEQLDDIKQQILSDLYMLGDVKISIASYINKIYKDLSVSYKKQIRNGVVSLIRIGLIQKDDLKETLEIHPIIHELIKNKVHPDIIRCKEIATFIYNKGIESVRDPDAYIYSDENEMSLENLCRIICRIDIDNKENLDYIINFMFDICKSRQYDWVLYLFADVFARMPKCSDNLKLLYLQFISMIYQEHFFAELDRTTDARINLEELLVNYIYDFYKEKNDGSEFFSSIFWKMILTFDSLLESFEYWGWDMSLYERINECIMQEESFGNTLYDYVFVYGDEEVDSAYLGENGEWVDEERLVSVPQYIREIYLKNQKIISEYGIDIKNKRSFEIYSDCVGFMVKNYMKKLNGYFEKFRNQKLSATELTDIREIYDDIQANPLIGELKNELQEKYLELFVLVDSDLKYQTMIEAENGNIQEVFETILHDKGIDKPKKYGLLLACLSKIIIMSDEENSYETSGKIVECISNSIEELITLETENFENNELMGTFLFAYLMTDYNRFQEIIDILIKRLIEKTEKKVVDGERVIFTKLFQGLIYRLIEANKCHLFYSFLHKYVDAILDLSLKNAETTTFTTLKYLSMDCARCAEAAYKETKDERYKQAYIEYKNKLKETL